MHHDHLHTIQRSRTPPMYRLPALTLLLCLTVAPISANLQQALDDGQAGKFQEALEELQRLSDELEAQVTSADLMIVGRNAAAIGFYSLLSDVASDSLSGLLVPASGSLLFRAAQGARTNRLDLAARLSSEVVTSAPTYLPARLLLARFRMADCMRNRQNCDDATGLYEEAIASDSALAVAYLDLGMLYSHLGDTQHALDTWEVATTTAEGHAATAFAHLMLAMAYAQDAQWPQARRHADKAKDYQFVGFAADILSTIEQLDETDSATQRDDPPPFDGAEGIAERQAVPQESEPDFMTGALHGLTSPLRFFGLFGLEYVPKKDQTDKYVIGRGVGCLALLVLGYGLYQERKSKTRATK